MNTSLGYAARLSFPVLLLFFACSGCEDEKDGHSKQIIETPEPAVSVPNVSGDSAFAFVAAQVDFGPRTPNSPAHEACATWMVEKLRSYGANVIVQEASLTGWDGKKLASKNIIAEINPQAKKRILLAAHWDTRPWADKDPDEKNHKKPIDGANDGGSGVGVLIELARIMQSAPPAVGVDLVFFDAEDYGKPEWAQVDYTTIADQDEAQRLYLEDLRSWCLGSQYWAQTPHKPNYTAKFGILLDMVGAADARFNREGRSVYYAPSIVSKVWRAAGKLGYGTYFGDEETPAITDDHVFVNEMLGIPTIDIIHFAQGPKTMGMGDYEFGSYHHTMQDNIQGIDPKTLKAVGQTLAYIVYHE